ncbi:hypothetical protein BAUCODRAFT_121872 [Baudoinia panamericana UAMH 10762]|uniref:Uncharacterized protein n=1 Tax=Baudoinia panamericana (strain UAMH 10762) TaxID=717646 RepID=M2LSG5_BAUPA|nr:uncharacterized protein BAUCODRAFT_121872 [Baudoinia panamericana UAMH 10762]EMC97417.1 hypothetical protein BAUCODRAFT_121872 [Baudoinia panamericana UAMH 10762]
MAQESASPAFSELTEFEEVNTPLEAVADLPWSAIPFQSSVTGIAASDGGSSLSTDSNTMHCESEVADGVAETGMERQGGHQTNEDGVNGSADSRDNSPQLERADSPLNLEQPRSDPSDPRVILEKKLEEFKQREMVERAPANITLAEPSHNLEDGPKGPTLLEKALAVAKQTSKGDLLVVFDTKDLAKTVRLSTKSLLLQVPALAEYLRGRPTSKTGEAIDGVHFLVVLEKSKDRSMPVLVPKALDTLAPSAPPEHLPTLFPDNKDLMIKVEDGEDVRPRPVCSEADTVKHSDWVKAYDSFLRIVRLMPDISARSCGLPSDAKIALARIERVVAVAEHYGVMLAAASAFKLLTNDWMTQRTLFGAIAVQPKRWLVLAVKLESELVYKEAFVHLVGQYPSVELDGVAASIVDQIAMMSRDLRYHRYEVDQQLLLTTIKVSAHSGKGKQSDNKQPLREQMVSPFYKTDIYNVVNLWRDWIAEHIDALRAIENGADLATVRDTLFCEHNVSLDGSPAMCLTTAGLYHLIGEGGDAYLPVEELISKCKQNGFKAEADTIRANLKVLKDKAKAIVAPLLASKLQYEAKTALSYVTCVDAGAAPWAGECGEVEETDDMDLD